MWTPITSSARPDGLKLHHWERPAIPSLGVKASQNAHVAAAPGGAGDYPFAARYNKKCELVAYR